MVLPPIQSPFALAPPPAIEKESAPVANGLSPAIDYFSMAAQDDMPPVANGPSVATHSSPTTVQGALQPVANGPEVQERMLPVAEKLTPALLPASAAAPSAAERDRVEEEDYAVAESAPRATPEPQRRQEQSTPKKKTNGNTCHLAIGAPVVARTPDGKRPGKITEMDLTDLPYKVEFADGDAPVRDWFRFEDLDDTNAEGPRIALEAGLPALPASASPEAAAEGSHASSQDISPKVEEVGRQLLHNPHENSDGNSGNLSIGASVTVRTPHGKRAGKIAVIDSSDLPYKVEFDDPASPTGDWFRGDDLSMVSDPDDFRKVEDVVEASFIEGADVVVRSSRGERFGTIVKVSNDPSDDMPLKVKFDDGSSDDWYHKCDVSLRG